MRRKAIGYIVECHNSGGMICVAGVLYFGRGVTLFASRRLAVKSIRKTLDDRPAFEDEFGRLNIRRAYYW